MKAKISSVISLVLLVSTLCYGLEADGIRYAKVNDGDASCDVGILYKKTPEGVNVEVAAIATGKGANFRKWEIKDIKMSVNGEVVRPRENKKFYTTKASFFRFPAALVFTAIGSQYERYADTCTQSGAVCPVVGQPQEGQPKQSGVEKTIDKTGMALGLGLLTAQAKGEVTGLKSVFKFNSDVAAKLDSNRDKVKIVLENSEKNKKKTIELFIAPVTKN